MKAYITLFHLPIWKWILLLILLVSIAHNTYYFIEFYSDTLPSTFDLLMEEIDNKACLCFMLTYCFLLAMSESKLSDQTDSYIGTLRKLLLSITTVVGLMLVANYLVVFTKQGTIFVPNIWYGLQELKIMGLTPFTAMIMGLVFLYLRFLFMGNLIVLINGIFRNVPGSLAVIVISCLESDSYLVLRNRNPLWIFPIEHTRLLNSYNAGIIEGTRISYAYSLLYWTVLIGLTTVAIHQLRQKGGVTRYAKVDK